MNEENTDRVFATPLSSPKRKTEGEELHISVHAISGTSSGISTFTLKVKIGKTNVIALVDSGSTTTFITPAAALRAQCEISNHVQVRVAIANGSVLTSDSQCLECPYEIQGGSFIPISGYWISNGMTLYLGVIGFMAIVRSVST